MPSFVNPSALLPRQVLVMLVGLVAACSEPPAKSDSTVFLDVVDINAKVEPPPPPPPKVGRLPVFNTPIGGTCRIERYRGSDPMGLEVHYDSDAPRRTISVGIARLPRAFPPLSLHIVATQGDGVLNEQETIVAGFTGEGTIQFGTRTYQSTGREQVFEKVQLSEPDGLEAVKFAQHIVTLCPDALR